MKPPSTAKRQRPLVIGHRGASYNLPEHTLASYHLALELGADYIEPDLVPTRDGVLVAMHALDLNITTNVQDVFPDRAQMHNDMLQYFVTDFTLMELRQLRVRQRVRDTPARSTHLDGILTIPTLTEILDLLHEWVQEVLPVIERNPQKQLAKSPGLYVELKSPSWINEEMATAVAAANEGDVVYNVWKNQTVEKIFVQTLKDYYRSIDNQRNDNNTDGRALQLQFEGEGADQTETPAESTPEDNSTSIPVEVGTSYYTNETLDDTNTTMEDEIILLDDNATYILDYDNETDLDAENATEPVDMVVDVEEEASDDPVYPYLFDPMRCNSTHMKFDEYYVPPLVVQCFDSEALQSVRQLIASDDYFHNVLPPQVLLVTEKKCWDPDFWFRVGSLELDGVGPDKNCLLGLNSNNENKGDDFMNTALEHNLAVHAWTERAEVEFVNVGFDNAEEEMEFLFCTLKVHGIFAENVDLAVRVGHQTCPGEETSNNDETVNVVPTNENKEEEGNTQEPTPTVTSASTSCSVRQNRAMAAGLLFGGMGLGVGLALVAIMCCCRDNDRTMQIPGNDMEGQEALPRQGTDTEII